jgi:integrase/recombinase XerD
MTDSPTDPVLPIVIVPIEGGKKEEPQADHLETEDLSLLWEALNFDDATRVRDRAIVAVPSHGLRASKASALNVEHWNGGSGE